MNYVMDNAEHWFYVNLEHINQNSAETFPLGEKILQVLENKETVIFYDFETDAIIGKLDISTLEDRIIKFTKKYPHYGQEIFEKKFSKEVADLFCQYMIIGRLKHGIKESF